MPLDSLGSKYIQYARSATYFLIGRMAEEGSFMLFSCPICKEKLEIKENFAAVCANRHSFDRAKAGYYHLLLPSGGGVHGDDARMVAARRAFPKLAVEVEVESVRECASALRAKPEWIMLDNMSCADMRKCVKMCRGISKTEASGGITLDRAREVAATGVTAISLGCLTHSQGSIDLTLEWKAV